MAPVVGLGCWHAEPAFRTSLRLFLWVHFQAVSPNLHRGSRCGPRNAKKQPDPTGRTAFWYRWSDSGVGTLNPRSAHLSVYFMSTFSSCFSRPAPRFSLWARTMQKSSPTQRVELLFGTGGRTRTDTISLPMDFESITSANSITPA